MRSRSAGGGLGVNDSTGVATSDGAFDTSFNSWASSSSYSFGQDAFGAGLGVTAYSPPAGALASSAIQTVSLSSLADGSFATAFAAENITFAGSALVFHNVYDSTVSASYRSAIIAAENFFQSNFTNPVTLSLNFTMANLGPNVAANNTNDNWISVSYSSLVQQLSNHAQSADDRTAVNTLANLADPSRGFGFLLTAAEAQILGLTTVAATGTVRLNSADSYFYNGSPGGGQFDAISVIEHELSEEMGRVGELGQRAYNAPRGIWGPTDLFRYSSPGVRDFTGRAASFSVDGVNLLTQYDPIFSGDGADWNGVIAVPGGYDSFGTTNFNQRGIVTQTDIRLMDIMGWNSIPPVVIESFGGTSLVQIGNNYSMFPVGQSSGPQIRYAGAPVVAGQFGPWVPIGAEQTGSGYVVAWKMLGADQYLVWNTDSSGNFLSKLVDVTSGGSYPLEALEPSFQQDLNGDGTIGVTATLIENNGTTKFVQVADSYFMFPPGSTGIQVKYNGKYLAVGQFGGWTPIAAEQTGSGYVVAWKLAGADQYLVWNTDSSGNYLSKLLDVTSGGSYPFESLEPSFQQDLNRDGTIGPTVRLIEASGSTGLVQVADSYFMYPIAGGPARIQLKYQGAYVAGGGGWTAIAAEAVGPGYQVVYKMIGGDLYTVWTTDVNGNQQSANGFASGGSFALEALEGTFHQDLNGDGTLGYTVRVLEASGSTGVAQVADSYFLYPIGGTGGPQVKYLGNYVAAGQFGPWTPIGAEAAGGGYQIAWKMTGADQYTVWTTDINGNYVSKLPNVVSGGSFSVESLEATFHQDLNGDGTVGYSVKVIEAFGSTGLAQVADSYFLYPIGGTGGPQLKYNNAFVAAGEFGAFTPIAAEQVAGGYDVAWKMTGADQYTVWSTDSSGNYLSNISGGIVTGSSATLKSFETIFHQDLNGNGTIGASVASASTPGASSSSGAGNLALLTNYLASTFAPTAGEGVSSAGRGETSDEHFLAKPTV